MHCRTAFVALVRRGDHRAAGLGIPTRSVAARIHRHRSRRSARSAARAAPGAGRRVAVPRRCRTGLAGAGGPAHRGRGPAVLVSSRGRSRRAGACRDPVRPRRPCRVRRFDPGHAGGPPARATSPHPALQADRDGARHPARSAVRPARRPGHLAHAGPVRRQPGRRARRLARLVRRAARGTGAGAGRAAGGDPTPSRATAPGPSRRSRAQCVRDRVLAVGVRGRTVRRRRGRSGRSDRTDCAAPPRPAAGGLAATRSTGPHHARPAAADGARTPGPGTARKPAAARLARHAGGRRTLARNPCSVSRRPARSGPIAERST